MSSFLGFIQSKVLNEWQLGGRCSPPRSRENLSRQGGLNNCCNKNTTVTCCEPRENSVHNKSGVKNKTTDVVLPVSHGSNTSSGEATTSRSASSSHENLVSGDSENVITGQSDPATS